MSIRALYSGVSGLKNFQTQLDVVGNNIANSQTPGFKSSRVTFMSMLYQTMSAASGPNGDSGGVNPKQVGLGSIVNSIDQNFEQGNLLSTGKKTDVAIQGNGFFAVTDGTTNYYTRSGAFDFDSEGFLVYDGGYKVRGINATDGVLGTSVEPIQIPLGITLPASGTTSVDLNGNLDSSAEQIGTRLETDAFYGTEQTGDDTAMDGLLATGSANTVISGLVDGVSTVTVATGVGSPAGTTYTYSSSSVGGAGTTFNSLDDLAANINNDFADMSVAMDSNGALVFTSAAAGNSLTLTSSAATLQTAMAAANASVGSFNVGNTSSSDQFSHQAVSTDALVDLRNSNGQNLGLVGGETVTINANVGGTAITPASLNITGSTLADLTSSVQSALGITTSNNVVISSGRLVVSGDGGTDYAITNMGITSSGSHANFDNIFDSTSGNYSVAQNASDNHSRSFTAYDSDGTAHTVSVKFNIRETAGNQTRYAINISSLITATGVADVSVTPSTGSITCGSDGSLSSFDPLSVTIQPTGVGDPMVITFDPGQVGSFLGIVMFEGDSTAGFRNANGYASGNLQDVNIGTDGTIYGNFTNGQIQTLSQIQLAKFDNPEGLENTQNSLFRESDNSGNPTIDAPNTGQLGALVVNTLESSNVDLANEFVTLITAQRGFQTNARVIKIADQILQELVNIV
ncbi:flagellar hook-basal body complex protein [bacterium]|nr:flagellar hook-basal body complex protein [bacterium]